MKRAITLIAGCVFWIAAHADTAAPAVWDEVRVGMKIDEAISMLRSGHAQASLNRGDKSGYKKLWPANMEALAEAGEIERAFFPHGHVLILHFDSNGIITEIVREFVSEEQYQESLKTIQNRNKPADE